MNISSRLKKLEKHISGNDVSEEELIAWLSENPYDADGGKDFRGWCDRMPQHLIKPYADYVKKHFISKGLDIVGSDL